MPSLAPAELLAPAGNWDCVRAAVANGADAIYFGLPRFNARLRADNFGEAELPEVVGFCHRHGVKAYVAFNTLVFTSELDDAAEYLRLLSRVGVDALIVQDVGLVRLAREIVPELAIHASTQMTITSPEGVVFARELGIERAVLARELSLRELEKFQSPSASSSSSASHAERGTGKAVGEKDEDEEADEDTSPLPLEVFVHGALCVAYSGQCLTSESLGQRSANRGECAQACRMPYELVVDGALRSLGDRRFLLSPQDLAAVEEIPRLLELGVCSFKIEGRLKSPEYVAAVCQVYRRALDAALAQRSHSPTDAERYQLEMTFSRGLWTGWMHGVDHQRLVPARSGKKRGPFAGRIARVGRDFVELGSAVEGEALAPLAPGDGLVFDIGGDTDAEQGGRIYQINGRRLFFAHGHIDFTQLRSGDRVWKTDDPALDRRLRQSFAGKLEPRRRERLDLRVSGRAGEPLVVEAFLRREVAEACRGAGEQAGAGSQPVAFSAFSPAQEMNANEEGRGAELPLLAPDPLRAPSSSRLQSSVPAVPQRLYSGAAIAARALSAIPLQAARTAPLTPEKLREHLGRFGESPLALGELRVDLEGDVILPIGELNRLRRELVFALEAAQNRPRTERPTGWRELLGHELETASIAAAPTLRDPVECIPDEATALGGIHHLSVLCRTAEQLEAALSCGVEMLLLDFEDIRRYRDAVMRVRESGSTGQVFLATPRIQKAGEQGFFKLIENARPDGVLVRNLGAIEFFRRSALRVLGDFSLNVANPLTAQHFIAAGMERVTISYDLNLEQVLDLLRAAPAFAARRFELTLHQHMPMFHMEHCVFAAFLSKGSSFLDCGRPCEKHRVHLRDRVGSEHPLRADVGCRNTLFNAVPQTGARFFDALSAAGLRHFRVELLEESAASAARSIRAYQALLRGEREGEAVWRELKAQSQLGVTRGTL